MRNYKRLLVLIIFLTFVLLCFMVITSNTYFDDDKSVIEAVKSLAPLGGTGMKEYYYPSGSVKERSHWKNYEILRIEYFDLSGVNIYTTNLRNGSGLLLEINDDGMIKEIYETSGYVRKGARFIFKDGRLDRITSIERDKVVLDVRLEVLPNVRNAVIPTEPKED